MAKRVNRWNEDLRPPPRDNNFTVPLDDEMLESAVRKAKSPSKLRAVIRSFLFLWTNNEYPEIPEDLLARQEMRAQKRRNDEPD